MFVKAVLGWRILLVKRLMADYMYIYQIRDKKHLYVVCVG